MPGHVDAKFRTTRSSILMAPILCRMSPYGEPFYDGISLEAMEVMFVKVKERFLEMKWSYAMHAQHYDKWSTAASQASVQVMIFMAFPMHLLHLHKGASPVFSTMCSLKFVSPRW